MPILNKLTGAFPTALIYITAGALITVWTLVYWVLNSPATQSGYFWVAGFLMTGLSFLVIGLTLGKIGRAARAAELPPSEVTPAAVQTDVAAARKEATTAATVSGVQPNPGTAGATATPVVPTAGAAPR